MADRVVRVRLLAQVAEYNQGMLQAANATRQVGTVAAKLAQQREAFQTLGRGLVVTGAAMVGTVALVVRAAAQWESAWAGVTKTVDGTPEQLAQVESGLRGLTKILPASHQEIAAVAEAAGQLGIQTPFVVAFTRTMIDMGETTNLSAQEAAMSLAQFMNIMGTSQQQASNLGSSVVALGNNFATTERDIVAMGLRLAGAGKQIGLTEGDVLGLATALSSVGIEAEAGGSAMSKVMIDIASSVESGGERLEQFARTAGMSADKFARKWRSNPTEALAAFVRGLANAEKQGSSAIGVLQEMGITEVRMRDALLRSAAAADMFSDAIALGNEAFRENTALAEEAQKRYATVESRIRIAGNAINDAAISFGEVLLPAVGAAADAVAGFADFMGNLPAPVMAAITIGTGLVGVLAFVGGTALLAVPKIAQFKVALEVLGISMRGLSIAGGAALGGLTALIGIIGAVAAAQAEARMKAESYADALAQGTDATRNMIAQNLTAERSFLWLSTGSLADHAETLGLSLRTVAEAVQGNRDAFEEVMDAITAAEQEGYKPMEDANLALYGAAVRLRQGIEDEIGSLERAREILDQTNEITEENAETTSVAATAYLEAAREAEGLTRTLDELIDTVNEANGVGQDAITSNIRYREALAKVDETIAKAKAGTEGYSLTLDLNTREGQQNMKMLVDLAKEAQDAARKQYELDGNTDNYRKTLQNSRDTLIQRARDLGYTAEEAQNLADKIFSIPSATEWKMIADTRNAQATIDRFIYTNNGRRVNIIVDGVVGRQVHGSSVIARADGGIEEYADGGFPTGIYRGRPGGIHKFAEPETGWEAYISGKPSQRDRNIGLWVEAGRRLGVLGQSTSAPMPTIAHIDKADMRQLAAMVADALRDVRRADGVSAQRATMQGVR